MSPRTSSRLRSCPVSRLSTITTLFAPRARRPRTRADPINPAPPVTRNRFTLPVSHAGSGSGCSRARNVIPGDGFQLPAQTGTIQDIKDALNGFSGQITLVQHQLKLFRGQRDEIQPETARGRTRGNTAIGCAGGDNPCSGKVP